MTNAVKVLAVLYAASVVVLGGCATTSNGMGASPYQVGPVVVVLTDAETVDRECRFRAPAAALGVGPILGCYLPGASPRIYATPDPHVILHEFKHHFEGAWHE